MMNLETVTGTVLERTEVSNRAIRYSFQVNTNVKIAVAATPGNATGTMIRRTI